MAQPTQSEKEAQTKEAGLKADAGGTNGASRLAAKACIPCRGGVPPLDESTRQQLLDELNSEADKTDGDEKAFEGKLWRAERRTDPDRWSISKTFTFKNFVAALEFVNRIGEIAEAEGHHPDLYLSWGKVGVEIWTHKIADLTESDFILAAKIDSLQS